jgi:hypothetical protein
LAAAILSGMGISKPAISYQSSAFRNPQKPGWPF